MLAPSTRKFCTTERTAKKISRVRMTVCKISTSAERSLERSGWAVVTTLAGLAVWVVAGFLADFSRTWELIMIAGLPVVMLLLLIVVQHTQNHDNLAMQLKLDELIRAHERSQDEMMRVEDASYEHLEDLERDFKSHVERQTDRPSAASR